MAAEPEDLAKNEHLNIVQYFREEMPKHNKQEETQDENRIMEKDELKKKVVEAAVQMKGKERGKLSQELEVPEAYMSKDSTKAKVPANDNDFIRMCEENLSDITKRYLMNDPNPTLRYPHGGYRGALAADLRASSILDDDNDRTSISLRMSNSFKQSVASAAAGGQ